MIEVGGRAPRLRVVRWWWPAALVAFGCATNKPATENAPDPPGVTTAQLPQPHPNLKTIQIDGSRCESSGRRADQDDLNQDGRADLVVVYAGPSDGTPMACKQADLNFDGRLDAYLHYDDSGNLEREQFDLDFDGRIDIGRHYVDGHLVLDEQDTNHDGYVDTWRRYEKGRLIRVETDRDFDGKPDMFAYYAAGHIDRIGYDVNGDGRVDQWDHDAARRARLASEHRRSQQRPAGGAEEYLDEPAKDEESPGPPRDPSAPPKSEKKDKGAKVPGGKAESPKATPREPATKKDEKNTDAKPSDPASPKSGPPAADPPAPQKPKSSSAGKTPREPQ